MPSIALQSVTLVISRTARASTKPGWDGPYLPRDLPLMGLIMREAGKTLPNAVSEIREAVDFLRYYGAQVAAHFAIHHILAAPQCDDVNLILL